MSYRPNPITCALLVVLSWPFVPQAQPQPIQDEIVVTATRLPSFSVNAPASVDRIAVDVLRAGLPLIDASELLNRVPGVVVQNRQNFAQDTQISARGFGARASFGIRGLKLYVDDIPASIPDGQGQGAIIPLFVVDSIEVLRGPWAVPFGNAAGGVISARSGAPDAASPAEFSFAAGPDKTRVTTLHAAAAGADVAGRVATQRLASDGFRAHSRVERDQTYARLDLNLASGHRLMFTGNLIRQPDTADPLGLTRAQFDADARQAPMAAIAFNTRKSIDHQQVGMVYDGEAGAFTWKVLAYGGNRDIEQFLSTPVAAQAPPASAGGVVVLDRQFHGMGLRLSSSWSAWSWTVGVDADAAREVRQGYENFTLAGGNPATVPAPTLGVRGRLRRDELNEQRALDGYAYLDWTFLPDWKAHAALRSNRIAFDSTDRYLATGNGDDSGARRYNRLTPALALLRRLDASSNLYVSASAGFETPTAAELAYRVDGATGLNFALAASTNRQLEAGYKRRSAQAAINVAVFRVDTDNEIVPATSSSGRTTFQNGGRTSRHGLEAGADWQPAFSTSVPSPVAIRMAYTYLNATFLDGYRALDSGGRRVLAGAVLPGIPKHQLFVEAAWRRNLPGWSAAIEWQSRARIFADDANSISAAAPGYGVVHARISYKLRLAAIELLPFLRVENVLDRKYISSVIVNEANQRYFETAPTRRWMAGVSARLKF